MKEIKYNFKCGNRYYWQIICKQRKSRKIHKVWEIDLYRSFSDFDDQDDWIKTAYFQGQYDEVPTAADCTIALANSFTSMFIEMAQYAR